jgi:uncharacterized protein (DUF983 family)
MTESGPAQPSRSSRPPSARQIDDQIMDVRRALPLFGRALRARCPNCGGRSIFVSWTRLRASCPTCGLRLNRGESDYFIGAYLVNLVAIELLVATLGAIVVITTYPRTPWTGLEWGAIALSVVGAVACYPLSQVLWLAADLWLRPLTPEEMEWHRSDGARRPDDLAQL